jgi:hypothetical protein
MNSRRTLAALLSELADSAAAFADAAGNMPVRARSLSLSLPIDLRVGWTDEGLEVIGDVPLFLTRTDFDPDPARLEVDWHAIPLATEEAS